jgi:hypothetical protein
MDEEDGREGVRAHQPGATDVRPDADAEILRQPGRSGPHTDSLHVRTAAETRVVRLDLRWPATEVARPAHLRVTEGEGR